MHAGDGPGAEIGLGAAGTLHPAAFGRCPRPSGDTTRPDKALASRSVLLAASADGKDGQAADSRARRMQLGGLTRTSLRRKPVLALSLLGEGRVVLAGATVRPGGP